MEGIFILQFWLDVLYQCTYVVQSTWKVVS